MPIGLSPRDVSSVSVTGLTGIGKGIKHNAAVGAATNWFVTDIAPTTTPCVFRCWIAAAANTGQLDVRITNGGATLSSTFLTGTTVGQLYEFDIMLYAGDTFNIRCANAVNVYCRVVELDAAMYGGAVSAATTP